MKIKGQATKKSIPIDWFRWKYNRESFSNIHELIEWIETFGDDAEDHFEQDLKGNIQVLTLEGLPYDVPDGYIIIRNIKGEYSPCESKIFKESYDIL